MKASELHAESVRMPMSVVLAVIVFSMLTCAAFAEGRAGWTKVLISHQRGTSSIASSALEELGVESVHTYDAFTLGRVPTARLEHAKGEASRRGVEFTVEDEWDTIRMPGATIDVRAPRFPAGGLLSSYPDGNGLYVVQFVGPFEEAWKKRLDEAGLTYVSYLPHNAAIVFGSEARIDTLGSDPDVQWTSIYHPAFRAQPASYPLAAEPRQYVVQLAKAPGHERVVNRLVVLDRGAHAWEYGPYVNVRLEAVPLAVASFSTDPHVVAIEEQGLVRVSGEREAIAVTTLRTGFINGEVYQDGTRPYKQTDDYRQWLSNRGVLDTSLYRIAFADTGFDSAPTNYRPPHPDLNRANVVRLPSYIGFPNTGDSEGHGTSVAGIAVGDPTATPPANMTQRIENGFYRGMGVAPKTGIIVQQVLSGGVVTATPIGTIAQDALTNGAAVQNHSNNTYFTLGKYTTEAQQYDYAVRDTVTATRQQLAMTVSAGNIGAYGDNDVRVLSPATAKNVISVGGVESYGTGVVSCNGGVARSAHDLLADGFRNVSWHSRRGTEDGRLKPDILAPSTMVNTTRTQYQASPSVYNAGGGCFATNDNFYVADSGTSYAAPQVAGAAVLIDRHRNSHLSPALLKASLIGNALSVRGGVDRYSNATVAARPNAVQGFGRLYLGDAFDSAVTKTFFEEGALSTFTGAGQSYTRVMQIANPSKPAVIVLAWTDEPAAANANPTLVRDLDLSVTQIGTNCRSFIGNSMTSTETSVNYYPSTCSPTTYDRKNNVEMIVIPANNAFQSFWLDIRVHSWGFGSANQKYAVFALNAY